VAGNSGQCRCIRVHRRCSFCVWGEPFWPLGHANSQPHAAVGNDTNSILRRATGTAFCATKSSALSCRTARPSPRQIRHASEFPDAHQVPPLVLQIARLSCNCEATARCVIYDRQWRGRTVPLLVIRDRCRAWSPRSVLTTTARQRFVCKPREG